jgi:hypothetical protein
LGRGGNDTLLGAGDDFIVGEMVRTSLFVVMAMI